MSDLRPIKWKRRFGAEAGKPVETLRQLRGRSLRGVLAHGCAYVAVDGKTASLLDRVCLGRAARGVAASGVADAWLQELAQRLLSERSAREAADAEAAAGPLPDRPRPPPLVALVRFSLLEAVFLVHGLECLTLFEETVRAPRTPRLPATHNHSQRLRSRLVSRPPPRRRACTTRLRWGCGRPLRRPRSSQSGAPPACPPSRCTQSRALRRPRRPLWRPRTPPRRRLALQAQRRRRRVRRLRRERALLLVTACTVKPPAPSPTMSSL